MRVWTSLRARLPVPLPPDPMTLLSEGARAAASFLAGQAGSVLANVFGTVGSLLVMLFALFFLLRDGTSSPRSSAGCCRSPRPRASA